MLGTLVGVSLLNAYLSARKAKTQIHDQLRDVARTLSQASFPLTDAVLRQTRGLSGAEFAVADRSGRVVSSSRKGLAPPRLPRPEQPVKQLELGQIVRVGKEPYFHTVVDLPRQSNVANPALLHVFYPEDSYRAALWNAIMPPLLVGGVALVLVVLLAIVVAARVTRPLGRLRSQVDRIARGEFQPIQLPRRNDEILDLGQSVNRMAEMLAGYEDAVRRSERLRTLGQLSGSMAHQLRNAATGCRMALELHRRACPVMKESETLVVALRQLALMERYIKHFFSHGNGPAKPHVPVELVSIVDDVLALLRPGAEHVGVRVQFVPPERPVCVDGDADDLEQMVINLLQNAIDAAAKPDGIACGFPGAGNVVVRIMPAVDGRILLEIQDSGAGPVREVREAMFEPLVTGKPDGTGLGLSLAQEIAKRHKSEIRWERRNGKTFFTAQFPLSMRETIHVEVAGR